MGTKLNNIEKSLQKVVLLNQNIRLFGFNLLHQKNTTFFAYCHWLKKIEKSLLKQWHYINSMKKQEFMHWQNKEYEAQLFKEKKTIAIWNQFTFHFYNEALKINFPQFTTWQSFIAYKVSEKQFIKNVSQINNTKSLDLCIQLFQKIIEYHPDQIMEDYLSLSENYDSFKNQIHYLEYAEKNNFQKQQKHITKTAELLLKKQTKKMNSWLNTFWKNSSGGKLSLHSTFIYKPNKKNWLEPLENKSNQQFSHFFKLERNSEILINNTSQFIHNKPAQNILLWGAAGCGKSSSIHALTNHFKNNTIKILEIHLRDIQSFLIDLDKLNQLKEKFIIFIDDISINKNETHFKALKSVLDGSLKYEKKNFLFYITSNLKNIIQSEVTIEQDDSEYRQKTTELSAFNDRFGIKLRYENPQFELLNEMLFSLASQKIKNFDKEELQQKFKKFSMMYEHDQPSARTIKQFLATLTDS